MSLQPSLTFFSPLLELVNGGQIYRYLPFSRRAPLPLAVAFRRPVVGPADAWKLKSTIVQFRT